MACLNQSVICFLLMKIQHCYFCTSFIFGSSCYTLQPIATCVYAYSIACASAHNCDNEFDSLESKLLHIPFSISYLFIFFSFDVFSLYPSHKDMKYVKLLNLHLCHILWLFHMQLCVNQSLEHQSSIM